MSDFINKNNFSKALSSRKSFLQQLPFFLRRAAVKEHPVANFRNRNNYTQGCLFKKNTYFLLYEYLLRLTGRHGAVRTD
jgi:hypothetical protein